MYELLIEMAWIFFFVFGVIVSFLVGCHIVCFVIDSVCGIRRLRKAIETIEKIGEKDISIKVDFEVDAATLQPCAWVPEVGHLLLLSVRYSQKVYDYPITSYVIRINPVWVLEYIMERKDLRVRDLRSICVIIIEHEIGHILSNPLLLHGSSLKDVEEQCNGFTDKEVLRNEILAWKHGHGCTGMYYDKEVYEKIREYALRTYQLDVDNA